MDDSRHADAVDSPDEAIRRLVAEGVAAFVRDSSERVALWASLGRILAEALRADRDSPPFDHSAMDGYAIRIADLVSGRELPVLGESRPGAAPPMMPACRGCIRVATGAPRPLDAGSTDGADAVVRREDVLEHVAAGSDDVVSITISEGVAPRSGAHWRRRGDNARVGQVLLESGAPIGAGAVAALATCGIAEPLVQQALSVALLTTGEEVVPVDSRPNDHEIRNGNAAGLAALLAARPWIRIGTVQHVPDEFDRLSQALASAIESHHAVVLTGGVSMGHRDLVRAAIEANGGRVVFHRVRQRPGRPMLGAVRQTGRGAVALFGLPGNPLSALTAARRIAIPVLAAAAGVAMRPPREVQIDAETDAVSSDLWRYRLATLDAAGRVALVPSRSSGDVISAGRSDGFVEISGGRSVQADERYPFHGWDD